jgi:TRAP-type C4-dicarboxylate transport system substrate-binding protein
LRERYRRFQSLPPERREALRDRWRQMTPEQRQRAMQRRAQRRPASVPRTPPGN